jgi:hypothetical protein
MADDNNKPLGMRKKKIFPAVCDYLRSLNPYPDRNFNDVYADFIKQKLNNRSFDSTRLSKWIQGSKSDLLKNPVYLDIMIQFIKDTFEAKTMNPEMIATQIRNEYQNTQDAFYNFVKTYETLYENKQYIQYLANVIRDETSKYNVVVNPEMTTQRVSVPDLTPKPLIHVFKNRKFLPVIIGIPLMIASIIFYAIIIAPETGAKPTQRQSGISSQNENQVSSIKKVVRYEQLPNEGQLIIPKGFYFQVKANMHGNARKFKKTDTVTDIVSFSLGVSKARANLFHKSTEDFPTVIWENSSERYDHGILTLKEYPENNTIEKIAKPMILFGNEQIIMFEYSIY